MMSIMPTRNRYVRLVSIILCWIFCFVFLSSAFSTKTVKAVNKVDADINADFVFVLDGSGTMVKNDPERIALEAMKQFADFCDDTCRMGYVEYSHQIVKSSNGLISLNGESIQNYKNEISTLQYDRNGDTDIALGLSTALNMLNQYGTSDRQRGIILLSDGMTDLPHGPRTTDESKSELIETVNSIVSANNASQDVYDDTRIYTIYLNENLPAADGNVGSEDEKWNDSHIMNTIASETGASSHNPHKAEELKGIITQILSDFIKLKPDDVHDKRFTIENNFIYKAIIIIYDENNDLSDIHLLAPGGYTINPYSEPSIEMVEEERYKMIKMIEPAVGEWELKWTSTSDTEPDVQKIAIYGMGVDQRLSKSNLYVGEKATVTAGLSEGNGWLSDEDLLSGVTVKTTIKGADCDYTQDLDMLPGNENGCFTADFSLPTVGTYSIITTITATSGRFSKTSRAEQIIVYDPSSIFDFRISLPENNIKSGETVDVAVQLFNNQTKKIESNDEFANNWIAQLKFQNTMGDQTESGAIQWDKTQKQYLFQFKPKSIGEYAISGEMIRSDTGEKKALSPVTLMVSKQGITPKEKTISIALRTAPDSRSESIRLADLFTWYDGDPIEIKVEGDIPNCISYTVSGQANDTVLDFAPEHKGTGELKLIVQHIETGTNAQLIISIDVEDGWASVRKIVLIVLGCMIGAILLILIAIHFIQPKARGNEQLRLNVQGITESSVTLPSGTHKIKLNTLIRHIQNQSLTRPICNAASTNVKLQNILKSVSVVVQRNQQLKLASNKKNIVVSGGGQSWSVTVRGKDNRPDPAAPTLIVRRK